MQAQGQNRPKKILVVDDSLDIRELLECTLSSEGFRVTAVESAAEALRDLEAEPADIIISDIAMGGMDGLEFCAEVRRSGESNLVPFIFLTVKSEVPEKVKGFMSGADDYVTKPFAPRELVARVHRALERSEIVHRQLHIDKLTGLFSRDYFERRLLKECRRTQRYGGSLTFAWLDIDHFKEVNDTYGHAAGDFVLARFAEFLRGCLRDTDVLGRCGGEEFGVILLEGDKQSGYQVLERLREKLSNTTFAFPQLGQPLRITVSVGLAACPEDGASPEELLAQADRAMYQAKRRGRNRVEM